MPLVFVPDLSTFFLHGDRSILGPLAEGAATHTLALVLPPGVRRRVRGAILPREKVIERLASVSTAELDALPGSIAAYALASKLALDLVAREHVVPVLQRDEEGTALRWAAALVHERDTARLHALARCLPPAAHAVPTGVGTEVWSSEAVLRAFLDAGVDALVRGAAPTVVRADEHDDRRRWETRWLEALTTTSRSFEAAGFAERTLEDELYAWSEPLTGAGDRPRASFRLELPVGGELTFRVSFHLQSRADPSLVVSAQEVWARTDALARLDHDFDDAENILLAALGRAARIFAPLERSLAAGAPTHAEIDASEAWTFLGPVAEQLSEAGFSVVVPGELTAAGARRLRLRMRIGDTKKSASAKGGMDAGLSLLGVIEFGWEAAIGDTTLTARELEALAKQKMPLVLHRGAWVAVDPAELAAIRARLAMKDTRLPAGVALAAALGGETVVEGRSVAVTTTGAFASLVERLRAGSQDAIAVPAALTATLRPYQERGLAWLGTMASLGLGACLADDMGLGKTVQLLAFLLHARERAPRDRRPTLLVAPTSVTFNWERECNRFAPSLRVVHHYGIERSKTATQLTEVAQGALVITTYAILRRDAAMLAEVDWSAVVLDEAQNVKNPSSRAAGAARSLRATHRFALTGTPVENRLAELWSILEFANPGMLGSFESFRRTFAVPIERHGSDAAAERLRRIVAPFLLRRVKTDPSVITDLPAKNEAKIACTLTREQASLYKAVLDAEMAKIAEEKGMKRRGRVLALLSFLKQVCNHPAQYLEQAGPLAGRSGKLARVTEMLEEVIETGDKALVFTQFRQMGERLLRHLSASLGVEVLFLHGGTPQRAREEMVRRFQEEEHAARVFVLSVKAGGTGLNLTAASHVFHYDRWWNPAVEDQATDRAYRIGQKRNVQVHKLVTAGTLEERIDVLLESKRGLAQKIVGQGEAWITEMGDRDLRDLFALSDAGVLDDEEDRPMTKTRSQRSSPAIETAP